MLAYMSNLDANFGTLLFLYHPENWEDLGIDKRKNKLRDYYSKKLLDKNAINEQIKKFSKANWSELLEELKKIYPFENYVKEFKNTREDTNPRYHLNQTLYLLRMSPINFDSAIRMRKNSLEHMYNSIISKISI